MMNTVLSARKILVALALLAFASLVHAGEMLFADHPLAGRIWDMRSHSFIDEAALLARTNKANVLLLGEIHDNPVQHELQQKLLKARIESAAKPELMPALMMEQLDAESQPALDQALAGSDRDEALNSVTGLIRFADWQAYRPLLALAVDNKLPVIAANTPNRKLQPVIWRGYAAYDAGELQRLAVEQVWNENRQNYLETHMGGAHCGKLRDELRAGLSRSQRLRDALMADSAVTFIEHSGIDRGVVAIVGSSHARRDIGLPLYFAARAPSARILSLAFIEVSPGVTDGRQYEADSATGEVPYDVVWFTPRVDRDDPCANLNMEAKPEMGK